MAGTNGLREGIRLCDRDSHQVNGERERGLGAFGRGSLFVCKGSQNFFVGFGHQGSGIRIKGSGRGFRWAIRSLITRVGLWQSESSSVYQTKKIKKIF